MRQPFLFAGGVLSLQKFCVKIPQPSLFPPVLFFLICTLLLCLPGSAFPTENWLDKIWFDKWVHIGLFTVLTVLWCWWRSARPPGARKDFLIITVLAILYGIIMEFVQRHLIPNRSFDTGDIIADAAGSLAGYVFSLKYLLKK